MREWLNLLGVLLIPLLIGVYTIVNNAQQTTLAQQQHDSDQRIAQQGRLADAANQLDQQREATLTTYEDDLAGATLTRATLTEAILILTYASKEQLATAASLKGAILPDGSTHP